jgi:hypothetical protein
MGSCGVVLPTVPRATRSRASSGHLPQVGLAPVTQKHNPLPESPLLDVLLKQLAHPDPRYEADVHPALAPLPGLRQPDSPADPVVRRRACTASRSPATGAFPPRPRARRDRSLLLADGADQIFARAITDLGGTLEVIVPAAVYHAGLPVDSHSGYDVDTCYSFLLPSDSSVAQVVGSRHIVSAAERSFRREPARTTSHREA